MRCTYKDCFNCPLKECVHDTNDRREMFAELLERKGKEDKQKLKERHARYYREHREEILAKQNKRNKEIDRKSYTKSQYLARKSELNEKRRQSYQRNRKSQLEGSKRYYWQHREEIAKKRKEKRERDRNRENKSLNRKSEKLELGCISTVQS